MTNSATLSGNPGANALPPAAQLMKHLEPFAVVCDSYVGSLAWVQTAADRVGVPRRYLSLSLAGGLVCFLLLGLGQSLVATLVGVAYPAYMSMKALDGLASGGASVGTLAPVDSLTQWCVCRGAQRALARAPAALPPSTLSTSPPPPPHAPPPRLTYWVVFSFFMLIEVFTDTLLFWLPFYWLAKIAFLVWLMHPATHGASTLYRAYLAEFFKKYTGIVDAALTSLFTVGASAASAASVAAARASGALAEGAGVADPSSARPKPLLLDPKALFGPGAHSE